jgi:tripartite-type tricarboxylate transporter receptor subunit TctC
MNHAACGGAILPPESSMKMRSDGSGIAMKKWLAVLVVSASIGGTATAQSEYPNRPVTLIVTSVPGGVTDVTGRALAQELTKAWGQPVIVENKGGAAHIIGAEAVAKSASDGYTLLVGESGTFTVNPTLLPKDKVPYDAEKDFVPITGLVRIYQSLLAAKSLPVENAAELIALAKQKPGQLTYGTAGVGSALHMNGALFADMAGIDLVPVHYRGATPALNDLIGGSINTMIVSVALGLPAYRAGQIKMLGVGAPKRMPLVSEVPTISESGLPGYQATAWFGLFAPAGTPDEVVMKIDKQVIRIFSDPAFRERFLDPQMFESMAGSPNDFAAFVRAERAKWAKLIAAAGIKAE